MSDIRAIYWGRGQRVQRACAATTVLLHIILYVRVILQLFGTVSTNSHIEALKSSRGLHF